MDIEEARDALDIVNPKNAIPMHYDAFSQIKADPQLFKQLAENTGHHVTVLSIGGAITF
jgi:L-ascorbate metabolism protein UlaG (beta-lactamase superfamily)